MSKNTPAKAGDAEPKPAASEAAAAMPAATTGATTETPSTDTVTTAQSAPRTMVKARVLTDCAFGKANSIALVEADVAEASPDLDPNEAAVAYAELLAIQA